MPNNSMTFPMGFLQGGTAQGNGSPPSPNHENGETMVLGPAVLSSPARETFIEMHAHESSRPSPLRFNAHVGTRHAHLPVRSSAAWIHPRGLTLFFLCKPPSSKQDPTPVLLLHLDLDQPSPLADCACQGSGLPNTSPLQTLRLQTVHPCLVPDLINLSVRAAWRTVGQLPSLLLAKPSEPGVPSLSLCGCWLAPTRQICFFSFPFSSPSFFPTQVLVVHLGPGLVSRISP